MPKLTEAQNQELIDTMTQILDIQKDVVISRNKYMTAMEEFALFAGRDDMQGMSKTRMEAVEYLEKMFDYTIKQVELKIKIKNLAEIEKGAT